MKECELCGKLARMYCESDQASLCWDCDEKVHGANFLVAKHLRSLLCNICQSPTPWQASGRTLTPTVSVCQSCRLCHENVCESIGDSDDVEEDVDDNEVDIFDSEDDDGIIEEEEEEDKDVDEDEEGGENQVVPWSHSPPLPPPAASSSNSGEEEDFLVSKRNRHNADLEYSDVYKYFSLSLSPFYTL